MYPKAGCPHLDMSMDKDMNMEAMDLEVDGVERGRNLIKHGKMHLFLA